MSYFIEVILPIPVARTFTYMVSEAEFNFVRIGARVAVPFGKSKFYTGIVQDIHHTAPTLYEAKEIHQIIDENPIITTIQLQHWAWIASYYMCTIGEVFKTDSKGKIIYDGTMIRAIDAKSQKTRLSTFKPNTAPAIIRK